ncbi:MAG: hypothetical protein JO328_05095 [Hyphomicrobiales bacterium]|nr:hypothetical protein [Hyphomicrobiales bacterium]
MPIVDRPSIATAEGAAVQFRQQRLRGRDRVRRNFNAGEAGVEAELKLRELTARLRNEIGGGNQAFIDGVGLHQVGSKIEISARRREHIRFCATQSVG